MRENDTSRSDEDLYAGFLKGERTAYDDLMRRHGDSLLWYLYGIVHDYQDAEDMMIESFARIMVKKPWISEGCFKAYLFKTARNLTIRHLKKTSKYELFDLDGMEDVLTADESSESSYIKNEKLAILNKCLSRIESEYREALYLVYLDGMSYSQAADVMKTSIKKLDHLLQKGKIRMREELKKEGVEDPYM